MTTPDIPVTDGFVGFRHIILKYVHWFTLYVNKQLQVFINPCLRRILNIEWPDVISNGDLWQEKYQQWIGMQINTTKNINDPI